MSWIRGLLWGFAGGKRETATWRSDTRPGLLLRKLILPELLETSM